MKSFIGKNFVGRTKQAVKTVLPVPVKARLMSRSFRKTYEPFTSKHKEKNYINAQIDYMKKKPVVNSFPFMAIIDPSNICNLRCAFCPTVDGEHSFSGPKFPRAIHRKRSLLALDTYNTVLDAFGDYLYSISLFNWGEPLFNENIYEMISMAKRRNIEVRLSTNLNIEDPDLGEKVCASGLDVMILSIDGLCQSTYAKYRRKGNFDMVMQNLKGLADCKRKYKIRKPDLIWQFLVFQHNEHEVPSVQEFALSKGADRVTVSGAYVYHEDWVPALEEYQPLGPAYDGICDFLWTTATIESTGVLSPCCINRHEKFDFGVFSSPEELRALWNGDKIRASRAYYHNRKPHPSILCDQCPLIVQNDASSNLTKYPKHPGKDSGGHAP